MYARQLAQRQRALERQAWQRHQQEQEALAGCTFAPAIDPASARMVQQGVRYGGSGMLVCSPAAGSASQDEAVRQQLQLLHRAGLNASASAALLTSQGSAHAASNDATAADGGANARAGAAPVPGGPCEAPPADSGDAWEAALAGPFSPSALRQAAPARPAARQRPPSAGASWGGRGGSPLKASERLYAHARDLQERQRLAPAVEEQVGDEGAGRSCWLGLRCLSLRRPPNCALSPAAACSA